MMNLGGLKGLQKVENHLFSRINDIELYSKCPSHCGQSARTDFILECLLSGKGWYDTDQQSSCKCLHRGHH